MPETFLTIAALLIGAAPAFAVAMLRSPAPAKAQIIRR